MALLYSPSPLLLSDVDAWVAPHARRQRDQALSILRALHIVQITSATAGGSREHRPQEITLTSNFRASLRLALEGEPTGGPGSGYFGVPSRLPVPPEIDIAFLDRHAGQKWEGILHFVVNTAALFSGPDGTGGAGGNAFTPKASVKQLLLAGGLVEMKGGRIGITQAGFKFLLQESNAQVWTLLLLWLESNPHQSHKDHQGPQQQTGSAESVDMLSFLFLLASLELGRAYDTTALSESRRNMLPALVDFGLVYVPPHEPRQFYPTRLATTLTSSGSFGQPLRTVAEGFAAATREGPHHPGHHHGGRHRHHGRHHGKGGGIIGATAGEKGSIILETNYRLYAYTNSPLQIAVLSLFTQLKMRFADMVSGRLTRESVRRAIEAGITADQVVGYLAAHAHDQMHRLAAAQGRPVLPPTVVDQIRLWQLENERMTPTKGFLFKDFDDAKEYEDLVNYADQIGVLVWKNDRKGVFFANKYEQLRDFLKVRKKSD